MSESKTTSASQSIARDGFWLMADNVVSMLVALGSSVIVARALGPEKMGHWNFVVWAAQMVKLVADFGIPLAVRRYVGEYRGRDELTTVHSIARVAERFQRAMSVVSVGAALAVVFLVAPPEQRAYAALVMVAVAPSLLVGAPASVLWATGNIGPSVRASLFATALNFVLTVTALALGTDLVGIAAALLISRLVDVALRYRAYYRVRRGLPAAPGRLPPDLRRRMVRFCLQQTVILAIEVILWNRSELFFLERYSPIEQVAFYSLTFNLVQYVLLLPQTMTSSVGATLAVRQGAAPQTVGPMASTSMWFIFVIAAPMSLGIAAVAEPTVRLMYGAEYAPAIPVLAILGLFGLARALSYPILDLLFVVERQGFVVGWSLVMVGVNVALGLWWIPDGGATGAAFAKGTVQTLSLAGLWIYASRATGVGLPPIRVLKVLVSSLVMAGLVGAFAYSVPAAWGALGGPPLGILVLTLMLRLTGALDAQDAQRLRALERFVPGRLRGGFEALLRTVVPSWAP